MKRNSFFVLVLAFACVPTMMFADFREQMDRFELGLSAGVGFYVAPRYPVAGNDALYRIHSYDVLYLKQEHKGTFKWPGIETFGGSFGYRFDTRWIARRISRTPSGRPRNSSPTAATVTPPPSTSTSSPAERCSTSSQSA
mgnify:CR=1 FL=1